MNFKDRNRSKDKETVLQKMVRVLPLAEVGPFRDLDGQLFVRIKKEGHFEHWPLSSTPKKGEHVRRWVEHWLYGKLGTMPKKAEVNEWLRACEGHAQFMGPEVPVFLRVALGKKTVVIDLCDDGWNVVTLSSDGWVVGPSDVRFRRTGGMRALPHPVTGGNLQEIFPFLNLQNDHQRLLILTWMLYALHPTGDCAILSITGPQGAAKSTLTRLIRSLTDPSGVALRTVSRNERNLIIAAQDSHILAFDNVSEIHPWFSDALCRLAIGAGMGERVLHTDANEILFSARRPIIFNGIGTLAERGDLRDRLVDIQLLAISQEKRQSESEFLQKFEAARSRIFGALLDALVTTLRRLPSVQCSDLPRMTEFARLGIAAERALGFGAGMFLKAYEANIKESAYQALESSPAVNCISKMLNGADWKGTSGELLQKLNSFTKGERRDPDWPHSARKMSSALSRGEPSLNAAGIFIVRLQREGGTGARRFKLEHRHTATPSPRAA